MNRPLLNEDHVGTSMKIDPVASSPADDSPVKIINDLERDIAVMESTSPRSLSNAETPAKPTSAPVLPPESAAQSSSRTHSRGSFSIPSLSYVKTSTEVPQTPTIGLQPQRESPDSVATPFKEDYRPLKARHNPFHHKLFSQFLYV